MSRYQNVDSNGRLHEGFPLHHTLINLESSQILQRRSRVHHPPEEILQRPEGFGTDRRREQHFRHPERNQTG